MSVGEGPLLGHILDAAAHAGVRSVYVAVSYQDKQVTDLLRSWRGRIPGLHCILESPSGTATAVRRLWRAAGQPDHSIIAAGDLVCGADDLAQLHSVWCERPVGAVLGAAPRRLREERGLTTDRHDVVQQVGGNDDSDLVSLGLRIQDRQFMELYRGIIASSRDTGVMSGLIRQRPGLLRSTTFSDVVDVNTPLSARIGGHLARPRGTYL